MEQELENKNADYGDESLKKRKRRQRLGMAVMILVVAGIAVSCITIFIRTRQSGDEMTGQDFGRMGEGFSAEGMVTATGTTSVGIEAVTFDIDFLESTTLYVEEVYLESGDTVEEGTKYLKLTQESIDDARKELESTLLSAQLEYRSGVISDKESRITAKYNYDLALLEAQQAQSVYDDTIASLQEQLDKAQAAYDDANEEYNELYNAIENDTFYEDYDIDALKKAYEDALDLYETKMADWELDEDDLESSQQGASGAGGAVTTSSDNGAVTVTVTETASQDGDVMPFSDDVMIVEAEAISEDGNEEGENVSGTEEEGENEGGTQEEDENKGENKGESGGNAGMQMPGGGGANNSAQSEQKWLLKAASLLKAEYEEAEEEYEQALSDYEEALDMAEINIQKLYLALETAREDLEDAVLRYQKQSQSATTKYETAVVKGDTAKLDYDTQLTSLDEQLEKLADAKEEAQDNLNEFEATVGDGYLYTQQAGTILMVMTQADKSLSGNEMLFAYSNPEKISVSVSVSQDYIAQLYVGEEATVIIDEYGQYSGTVQTINPVSASDNRTSVYYTVTVLLDTDDISGLSSNLTATVVFGAAEMSNEMPQGMDGGQPDGEMPNEMPGEMETQPDGEMPNEMPGEMETKQDMGDRPDMDGGTQDGGQHEKENN
jgi:hypothetical protein